MTFQIFEGQGVRHLSTGKLGVVCRVGKVRVGKKVVVAVAMLRNKKTVTGRREEFGPASMKPEDLAELQQKIENYPEQRGTRTLISIDDVGNNTNLPRRDAPVTRRKDLRIETELDNGLVVTGGKCEHGVYIPASAPNGDRSPYCSICHPYVIFARKGAEFKA